VIKSSPISKHLNDCYFLVSTKQTNKYSESAFSFTKHPKKSNIHEKLRSDEVEVKRTKKKKIGPNYFIYNFIFACVFFLFLKFYIFADKTHIVY
jgi:hypothetical protein